MRRWGSTIRQRFMHPESMRSGDCRKWAESGSIASEITRANGPLHVCVSWSTKAVGYGPNLAISCSMPSQIQIGYKLSSEEFPASRLVDLARAAEEHGFSFALISDHYHPWTDRQGQSPFVWSVLGAVAQTTNRLVVGTGVTCPTMRMHPAIVAQAAATVTSMMPGRFFLGVGSGENLNEHIVGNRWPEVAVRQERLEEAIAVIRLLWKGGLQSFHGKHFTVENARLYSLPPTPPPLLVAASGERSAEIAGRAGDGLIATAPERETVEQFRASGGAGKPCYAEATVCFDRDQTKAEQLAREIWPIAALPGPLTQELPLPSHFEKAGALVTPENIAEEIACGPAPDRHLQTIQKFINAGFDRICIHQIGPNQEEFLDFYAREVLPRVRTPSPVAA
jgi:coenzyme F420-dependent glucose-6-phosphate dehydrogenase